jgi:hypothetical protein
MKIYARVTAVPKSLDLKMDSMPGLDFPGVLTARALIGIAPSRS